MAQLIDRRPNAKGKSTVNRQRFLRRHKQQIKRAISEQISERSITNIDSGESVSIPTRDIAEPTFRSDQGGVREGVFPGNKEFAQGDRLKRPVGGGGGKGRRASDSGEGEDDFVFEISRDEYLDLLFDDLELPNLEKNQLKKMTKSKTVRAGFTNDGVPANINIVRSLRSALSRRVAMGSEPRRRLRELEAELAALPAAADADQRALLEEEIETLRGRIKRIPFIDTFDLRFNNYVQRPEPTSQAVMFCLMDVSGSMDRETKDIAKRFFILLHLFLQRKYERVELVFIRHTHLAQEVDEETFFYSRESGGTKVSTALVEMQEIVKKRYPVSEWNIYAAQASDGDNIANDTGYCVELLENELLPVCQFYAYVEILTEREVSRYAGTSNGKELWRGYRAVDDKWAKFSMKHIAKRTDIYPVFRELFGKNEAKERVA